MGNCISAKSKAAWNENHEYKNGQFLPNVKHVETYSTNRPETIPRAYLEDEVNSKQDIIKDYVFNYPDLKGSLNEIVTTIELMGSCSVDDLVSNEQITTFLKAVKRFEEFCSEKLDNVQVYASFMVDIDGLSVIRDFIFLIYDKYILKEEYYRDEHERTDFEDECSFDQYPSTERARSDICRDTQCLFELLNRAMFKLTNSHDAFCKACREKNLVPVFLEIIKNLADKMAEDWKPEDEREREYTDTRCLLFTIFGTVYNIARRTGQIHSLEDFTPFFPILLNWATTKPAYLGIISLLCVAHQLDEKRNYLIENQKALFQFLVDTTKTAVNSLDRKSYGVSASELADGLRKLAINDNNKRTLACYDAVETLVQMIDTVTDQQEELSAATALWVLAFEEENRQLIAKEERARKLLNTLVKCSNSEVRNAARGVLWEIDSKRERGNILSPGGSTTESQHVMISYHGQEQSVVKEVKNRLQAAGFNVCMGIEMESLCFNTMTRAVEGACAVLMCVSQKYKESPNCRSEAEYACQMKKQIVPLLFESGYQPDGWLGTVVKDKPLIDFSQRSQIKSSFEKLVCALRGDEKVLELDESHETPIQIETVVPETASSPTETIARWTRKDVKKWVKGIGTLKLRKKALKNLDGLALIHLHKLRKESPDYFYQSLKNNFGLKSVFDVFTFRDELEKLLNSGQEVVLQQI